MTEAEIERMGAEPTGRWQVGTSMPCSASGER